LDAAIQFKLGFLPLRESLSNSNLVAKQAGKEFESDSDSLSGGHPSLKQMATSNINLDVVTLKHWDMASHLPQVNPIICSLRTEGKLSGDPLVMSSTHWGPIHKILVSCSRKDFFFTKP
jgi:hypothetical protein